MSALWRVPRDAVVILTDEFVDALPTVAVAVSLALGGLVAAYLVQRIGEYLTSKQSHTTLTDKKTDKSWKAVTVRSRNGWIRLITMLVSLGLATAGFWVGAQSAGFNFWTLIIGYGIFSVVLGSAFGGALSDIGTFFLISLTDAVEEGQYILLHGMGLEMKITAIHFLWIEGVYVDSTLGKVEIRVPMRMLWSSFRLLDCKRNSKMSALWRVPRDAVVILTDEFVDALPTFAVAMSLAAGGLVAAYLVQRIGECLTGKQSHTNYKRTTTLAEKKTEKDWKAVTVRSRNGWIRLIAMLISLGLATAGFWVGAQSAGFNFWTLIIGYGIFSVVLGSAFGGALSDIGTFFLISLTDAVEEGQYILLHGMGLEMKITAIHFLWIEGVYVDSTLGKVEIHVPTSTLMRNTFLRVFSKESAYERVTPDPDDVYVGSKLGHGLRDAGKIV